MMEKYRFIYRLESRHKMLDSWLIENLDGEWHGGQCLDTFTLIHTLLNLMHVLHERAIKQ
jgi:hypothetical protein